METVNEVEPQAVPTRRSLPRYVIALWAVVAAFFLIALVRSLSIGIWFRDPHDEFVFTRMEISLAILVGCALVDAIWRAPIKTFEGVLDVLWKRWTRRRLVLVLSGLLGYHIVYWTYHNMKSWDVFNSPKDDLLRSWDDGLFLGHSPAVLLHDLLGTGFANTALVFIYQSFSAVIMFAVVAFVAFAPTIKHSYVALVSMAWIWVLGVATYYAIPSLGPFATSPNDFAKLPHTVVTTSQQKLLDQRDFLLAHPHTRSAFAQISAFASLHTGVTAVVVLLLWYFGHRRLSMVLAVFLVLVMVATIYLGYHFVADDVAGLLIAYLAVAFGRITVWGRRPGLEWQSAEPPE